MSAALDAPTSTVGGRSMIHRLRCIVVLSVVAVFAVASGRGSFRYPIVTVGAA